MSKQLLIFILNKEEFLEEILEAFIELDISGATIIDSIGMGRILAHDIPIFAGFRNLMQESRAGNKTIFTVVDEQKIERVVSAIEQIIGPLTAPGTGVIITLPVGSLYGITK
jgi:nitrogen regulatory protein P-II 1